MYLNIDLHTHTLASDGALSPEALVDLAIASGLCTLAITDHDEVSGTEVATAYAADKDLQIIPGVELSVTWGNMTIHLVGLQIDPKNRALNEGLDRLRQFRNWRAEEMGRRLDKAGIPGAYLAAKEYAQGRVLSRTHFARFLVENGSAKDMGDVFKRYLKPNKPGYVSGEWATLAEGVEWIKGAGGVASIAHPARYKLTATKLRRLCSEFIACGGEGLEVVSGSHSAEDNQRMAKLAADMDLLASAGSDFHDPQRPWIRLGKLPTFPVSLKPVWSRWDTPAGSISIIP